MNKEYDSFLSTPKKLQKCLKKHISEKADYSQLYGEPPPSYKVAKYLPNAIIVDDSSKEINEEKCQASNNYDIKNDEAANMVSDQCSHIYEHIDDILQNINGKLKCKSESFDMNVDETNDEKYCKHVKSISELIL